MKIGVYVRSSTARQEKGLDAQRRAIDSYLESRDISSDQVLIFEDNGISGSKRNRPGLNALLESVKSGHVEKVVCYSFSRISRSIRDLLEIVDELEAQSVQFISLSENIDTSTPIGKCFLAIVGALNQAEREILSERTRNGLRAAKARGKALGRPKTRPDKLIQELSSTGMSQSKIAEMLGISRTTVHRELRVPKVA